MTVAHLYLLKRIGRCPHDAHDGFVIEAHSPASARRLAAARVEPSDKVTWRHPENSILTVLGHNPFDSDPKIILEDFLNG